MKFASIVATILLLVGTRVGLGLLVAGDQGTQAPAENYGKPDQKRR
jgi:hypothetical protein